MTKKRVKILSSTKQYHFYAGSRGTNMQVILLKDVAGVGQRGAIKTLSDGYALNYLLPRGLAQQATGAALAAAKKRQEEELRASSAHKEQIKKTLIEISGKKITLRAKANEHGHLFKGIKVDDVVGAIKDHAGVAIDREMIGIGASVIKEVGTYVVHLSGEGIESTITLEIVPESR